MSTINPKDSQSEGIRKKPERKFGGLKDLLIRMADSFDDPMDELGNWDPTPSSKMADATAILEENK